MNRKLAITALVSTMTAFTYLGVNSYTSLPSTQKVDQVQQVQQVEVTPQPIEQQQEKRVNDEPSRGGTERPPIKETKTEEADGRYTLRVQVTAYTPYEPGQTSGTGLAYDGRPARPYHTMAVDTSIIPLGSKVYVPGLGWFLAHDTGSAIHGNIVDVCLDSYGEAAKWGRRTLEITVIPPKEKYKMAW